MFEGNPTEFLSSKNGDSSANADHNNTFTDGVLNIIGRCSEGAAPIKNIEPPNGNLFTKTHGLVNTDPVMNSLGANIGEMSRDKFPSIVSGIFTAAMTDGGLESHSKQDVIQTCAEYRVKEVVKQNAVQTGVEDSGGGGVVGQEVSNRFGKKNYTDQVVGYAFEENILVSPKFGVLSHKNGSIEDSQQMLFQQKRLNILFAA